ncbi:MAG: hypothetical protein WKF83_17130 [Nocardioidaceae bacterium]
MGDAVATTTPTFGRGLATTFVQVRELLALLDSEADPGLVGEPFDAWCQDNMLPWVLDHVHMDGDLVRRWQGGDLDLTRRLPSDLILSAATEDPVSGTRARATCRCWNSLLPRRRRAPRPRRLRVRLAARVQLWADPKRARRNHRRRPPRAWGGYAPAQLAVGLQRSSVMLRVPMIDGGS